MMMMMMMMMTMENVVDDDDDDDDVMTTTAKQCSSKISKKKKRTTLLFLIIYQSSITAILFCVFASVCVSVCLQYQTYPRALLSASLWSGERFFEERKVLQNGPFHTCNKRHEERI